MTGNEYQAQAMRTAGEHTGMDLLINGVMGLAGEAGECVDLVKKVLFQEHDLDRQRLAEELGDVAWYLAIAQEMRFPVDLRGGLMEQPQRGKLMRGDKNAAVVIVQLYEDKKPFEGDDVTVTGKFSRGGDGIDVPLSGTFENGEASVVLDEHCFAVTGRYELRVKLTMGDMTRTVLYISGYVESDGEGGILDVENVIPSIDDIVAQYAEMKRVTEETMTARDEALTARDKALSARDEALHAAENAGFKILDRYDTYAQMVAAHPTGEAGDAYAVGTEEENEIYVWGVDALAWINIGSLRGPKGADGTMKFEDLTDEQKESLRGPRGIQGPKGDTPERGVDYWTAADIAEIQSYVDDAILGGAW